MRWWQLNLEETVLKLCHNHIWLLEYGCRESGASKTELQKVFLVTGKEIYLPTWNDSYILKDSSLYQNEAVNCSLLCPLIYGIKKNLKHF